MGWLILVAVRMNPDSHKILPERPLLLTNTRFCAFHKVPDMDQFKKFLYKSQCKPYLVPGGSKMHNEFTAIIEKEGDWYIAYCPEIPGANGQGKTTDECRTSLAESINLILEDRRKETV